MLSLKSQMWENLDKRKKGRFIKRKEEKITFSKREEILLTGLGHVSVLARQTNTKSSHDFKLLRHYCVTNTSSFFNLLENRHSEISNVCLH